MENNRTPKIYVAGPDLFQKYWPDKVGEIMRFAEAIGAEALVPHMPAQHPAEGLSITGTPEDAKKPYAFCVNAVTEADVVIGNLNPFRGDEPDSGTIVELTMAKMLGKIVIGHTLDSRTLEEKLTVTKDENGVCRCSSGAIVERFDLPVNLMVALTCDEIVFGGVGVAMIRAVATWKARSKSITRENMRQIT
ncbi:nucleoside 2-deoxyribosyltransferase (plasmid) [Acidithiobacillus ferriphilus]|uniref:nucleoside 2-deoxyribosyltransferase n=1 Tax=Acidithiobacillus TaxID=119977 RepID=UPI002DBCC265|nr:nucleoside 2-deoxyribosyltransferase [Acidithiobacillus ferriphilus]MEB8474014.1 nucleoside 2-deoxyribosyltransferase [Acidithiobacillus ferriphilus]